MDWQSGITLVTEVQKRPCIYNTSLPGYLRKDLVEAAWEEIGWSLKQDPSKCKEKWRNIRTVFIRYLNQNSAGKVGKPYYLFDKLQFIVPFLKCNTPVKKPDGERDNFEFYSANARPDSYSEFENEGNPESCALKPSKRRKTLRKVTKKTPMPKSDTEEESDQVEDIEIPSDEDDNAVTAKHEMSYHGEQPELERSVGDEEQQTTRSGNKMPLPYQISAHDVSSIDENDDHIELSAHKSFLHSLLPDLMQMTHHEIRQFKRKVLDCIDDIFDDRPQEDTPSVSTKAIKRRRF